MVGLGLGWVLLVELYLSLGCRISQLGDGAREVDSGVVLRTKCQMSDSRLFLAISAHPMSYSQVY